ncbi:DNA-processing protein DprA [Orbaceae bacterium ESL0727]|nr:DNA-processing protein DprA [Orbaceae bacterium ESL0727]
MILTKYEFLLRISMTGQGKLRLFKKIGQLFRDGLPANIDTARLLKQLQLTDVQQALFFKAAEHDIAQALAWLDADVRNSMIAYCDMDYPPLLKQISAAPPLLFIQGDKRLLLSPQLAMVGSREFSEYGAQWARYFAGELAINGMTITSGLAMGIDAICHRGTLDVAGNTIAVLGSGSSHITPRTNLHLAKDILAAGGAIVSEFLPATLARPEYFPRRNRIISGLSLGTFVVEASTQSGSLITARYALEQNRDVFALPGEINNDNCSGSHWLIKQGAYLVTHPTDILEHYSGYLSHANLQQTIPVEQSQSILHPEIFAVIHHQPISVDRIAEQLELSIPDITIKLLDLELEGLIKTVTGGYIRNRIP